MAPNNFNTLAKNYAAGSILEENLKGSQVSNSILLNYFNQRAVIEKEYCEKLKNLSKVFDDTTVVGRIKNIFEITKNQLLSISNIKLNIFDLLNNQYEKSFAELSSQQNEEFQKYYENITDERNKLINAHNEKDERFKEYSVVKNEIIDLIKEYKKTYEDSVSKKIEDAFDREKKLRIKYIYAKDKYDREKRTCMNHHNETSESFRYLERERTEFIIKHLTNYINNLMMMNRQEFESYNILINNLNTVYSTNDNLNELFQFNDLLNSKDENSVEQVNKEMEKLQSEYKNEKKLRKFRKGKKKQNILHVQNVTETENDSEQNENNKDNTAELINNQESPSEEIIATSDVSDLKPELLTIHDKRNTQSSALVNFDDLIETMQNYDRTLDRSDQISVISKNSIKSNIAIKSSNSITNSINNKENNTIPTTSNLNQEICRDSDISDNSNDVNATNNNHNDKITINLNTDNDFDNKQNNNENTILNNNINNTDISIDNSNIQNTNMNSDMNVNGNHDTKIDINVNNDNISMTNREINNNVNNNNNNNNNDNDNFLNTSIHEYQLPKSMSNDDINGNMNINNDVNDSFINRTNNNMNRGNSYNSMPNIDTGRHDITDHSQIMISPNHSPQIPRQNLINSPTNSVPTQNYTQYQRRNMSFSVQSSPNPMVKRNSNDSNKTTGSIKSNHSRSSIGSMISSIFQSQSSQTQHKLGEDRRSVNSDILGSSTSVNIPNTPRRLSSKHVSRNRPQSAMYYSNTQTEKPLNRQLYYKPPSNSRHESLCCTLKRGERKSSLRDGYYTPQLRESHYSSSMQNTNSPLISGKSSYMSGRSPSIPYMDINSSVLQENQNDLEKNGKRLNSMRSNTSLSTIMSNSNSNPRSNSEISIQQKMHNNKNIPNTLNYNYDPYDISIVKPILFYVRVLFDYNSAIFEEISVRKDMIIPILETQEDGWWEGEIEEMGPTGRRRRRGLLPSNFVEIIKKI